MMKTKISNPNNHSADEPMFDPDSFGLTEQQREMTALARELGINKFSKRAAEFDRDARFPTDNYRDLKDNGLLALCIPREHGGLGADFKTYMLTAAEIGRYCGSTALTFNMHTCACLWSGDFSDAVKMDRKTRQQHKSRRDKHYKRMLEQGAVYSQPFSEGGSAAAGTVAFSTSADKAEGGWVINGRKIFASLSGHCDYYGILCSEKKDKPTQKDTMYIAVPADAEGLIVYGDWDPLGMRGTVSRNLSFNDVFVAEDEELMPPGVYYAAVKTWPHMFLTLTATYVGLAQAAYDFTINYLRGEAPGMPPVKRRMYPTKQIAVAQMRIMLEQTKTLWLQAVSEARPNPSKQEILRAYAAHYTAMENANEIAQLAIRTCGGHAMLKSLSLERIYRDSRCGSLMLPWTAEICLDRIGREALYEAGETDD
jgi:alkylation response protein AidB-like acyl-CoA dehydrogenase